MTSLPSSINPLDGRVMDPVHCGQYPQMACFQPSVTHQDFTLEPFMGQCLSPTKAWTGDLNSYCVKQSGHWHEKGYLPSHMYGPYGDYGRSCQRWLTTYQTHFPDKYELKGYPLNDLHVQPSLHCFRVKPYFGL